MSLKNILTFCISALTFYNAFCATEEYASFYANPFRRQSEIDTSSDNYKYIMGMKWIIDGKPFTWYDDTLYVKTDSKPDTIFFQERVNGKIYQLICMISEPNHYNFIYNVCCGAFNVTWNSSNSWGGVQFNFQKTDPNYYLGTIHETGLVCHKDSINTVSPQCISAMANNIYPVSLNKIYLHKTSSSLNDSIPISCMTNSKEEYLDDFAEFSVYKRCFDFLYLPLSDKPLKISYNNQNGSFVILPY
ncbi:MAG: hypothetical protein JNJ99_07130 [Crocinitomicaceae bacterium]|nr:hypothetical protein [Crocinitomicaceae bacterium]